MRGGRRLQRFLVAGITPESEVSRIWPWLGLVPRAWRRTAGRLTSSRIGTALLSGGGSIGGVPVSLSPYLSVERAASAIIHFDRQFQPRVHGWLAKEPPPAIAGVSWYTGRLYGLLAVLSLFAAGRRPFGDPARLSVLLIGGNSPEVSVTARFLAPRVRRLILASPFGHFRDRLAWQILSEYGLAIVTRFEPPKEGWELALDLTKTPPNLCLQAGRVLWARPHFADPLLAPEKETPAPENEDPVWAECHLACRLPPDAPPLPQAPTLKAVSELVSFSREIGLSFSLEESMG